MSGSNIQIQMKGFYFITDAELSLAGNASNVAKALNAAVKIVQYRRKSGSSAALYAEALQLKGLCREALFLVNDRLDIALAIDADGVRIGQEDLPLPVVRRLLKPEKVIGVTVRCLGEALKAEADGADYLGVGPIFFTATKTDAGHPTGVALLRQIREACKLPLAAIGGITLANAREVIAAGADMICAISATVTDPDVEEAVRGFQQLFLTDAIDNKRGRT